MGTVFLHLGAPKTGTTSLQRFLMLNREALESRGFIYPDFGYSYPDVGKARNGYFVTRTGKDTYQKEWEDSFRQLAKLGKSHDRIIISDEAIWNRQKPPGFWELTRKKFEEAGVALHIIVYLRRQDGLVESVWNQKVKGKGKTTMSFDEFMEERYKFMPMAYDEWLDRIVEEGKPEQLTVRVFERGQLLGGSVIDDFCDVIGLRIGEEFVIPKDSNASFSEDVVAVKRMINRNRSYRNVPNFYYEAVADTYWPKEKEDRPKQSMFSPEQRREFMERFKEGNAYVARKYFGREDGVLFYEPMEELPQWQPDMERMLPAAVRVLSGADILLYKRIDELEKRMNLLYNSLPARMYRKMRGIKEEDES